MLSGMRSLAAELMPMKHPRDGIERMIMGFPDRTDTILNGTEYLSALGGRQSNSPPSLA